MRSCQVPQSQKSSNFRRCQQALRGSVRSVVIESLERRQLLAVDLTIQAEDFDAGGPGVAYFDRDSVNQGTSNYRSGEAVDLYARPFGVSVGHVQATEWLQYTVNVPETGAYDLSFRVSHVASGAKAHFDVDGADVTGTIDVPNTGSWSTYQIVTVEGVNLTAGSHVLRLSFDSAASNGSVGDYDWVRISGPTGGTTDAQPPTQPTITSTRASPTETEINWSPSTDNVAVAGYDVFRGDVLVGTVGPAARQFIDGGVSSPYFHVYRLIAFDAAGNRSPEDSAVLQNDSPASDQRPFLGAPFTPGQTIQAEDFDAGGQGVAYDDRDTSNRGTSDYRPGEGVDVYARSFGRSVGYVQSGEWLEYTIDVPETATYDLSFRVANTASGARAHFSLDGTDVTGPIDVPNTGSWSSYHTVTVQDVSLPVGTHVLRLDFRTAASNGSVGDYDWIRFDGPTGLPADNEAPTQPDVYRQVAGSDRVEIYWNGSTDNVGVAGYEIRRDGQAIATLDADARGFTDTFPRAPYVHTYDVIAFDAAGNRSEPASIYAENDSRNPDQQPFLGTPFSAGQTIQAEDFDEGGEGVAYSDRDAINRGTSDHRSGAGVDLYIGPTGVNLGYVQPGEWTEYTVNVPESGDYEFSVRVAHVEPGAQFRLSLSSGTLSEWSSGNVSVPNTGSWNNYTSVKVSADDLPAGEYTLRLYFATAATNGSVGNYDWLRFDRSSPT